MPDPPAVRMACGNAPTCNTACLIVRKNVALRHQHGFSTNSPFMVRVQADRSVENNRVKELTNTLRRLCTFTKAAVPGSHVLLNHTVDNLSINSM